MLNKLNRIPFEVLFYAAMPPYLFITCGYYLYSTAMVKESRFSIAVFKMDHIFNGPKTEIQD
jgi:hypothetical protein